MCVDGGRLFDEVVLMVFVKSGNISGGFYPAQMSTRTLLIYFELGGLKVMHCMSEGCILVKSLGLGRRC